MLSAEEIERDLGLLRDIVAQHRAPAAPLAVSTLTLNGIETPVFTRIPENLHGVYKLGLQAPDLPFLIYQNERYSFGETYRLALNLANALISDYGVRKGDRVAICSRNNPEWCIAFMAITMTGAIVVPMNSWWQSNEIRYGLENSGSRILFADQERIDRLASCLPTLDIHVIAIKPAATCRFPELHAVAAGAAQRPLGRNQGGHDQEGRDHEKLNGEILPDDDASILYTSGSTGHPKGVLSTHRNIVSAIYNWLFVKEITEILRPELREENPPYQPGILANVPLFHVTGCHAHFLASFLYLRKLVLMYKWNAEQALELIEKERLSILHGVPTMTWEVMNSPKFAETNLSSLRSVQSGGAARPPEHLALMQKKFPEQAVPGLGYGLTETNAIGATITGKFYLAKPQSTGRATQPVTAIRIVDEEGRVLANGQIGEICIKGATVMKGYWNMPEATAQAIKDGWFHTGDLGLLDEHGFLIIKDRAKDIVIRGGENIGCAEVEYALAEHPQVCESAVFGLPDERLGEIVAAVVMVKADAQTSEAELQEFLQRRLAQFKVPSRLWIQKEQLPRIASGKIAKKQIRQRILDTLINAATAP